MRSPRNISRLHNVAFSVTIAIIFSVKLIFLGMFKQNLGLIVLGLMLLNPTRGMAQTQVPSLSPGRILIPRTPPQPVPLPENTPLPSLEVPSPGPIAPSNLPNIPGEIVVKEFQFTGNTAFNQEELQKATESFVNRPITFAELLQAEATVTKLYTDAGYINSGAIIPANQTFSQKGAVVTIQIIEGSLEAINVKVDGKLDPEYVRSRLAIATGTPFNQKQLLQALQLLQLNPLIKSISAEISAGSVPELSLLSVNVQEADTFDLDLFVDNGKVRSIGSVERGLQISEGNLLGIGDAISLEYANSDGSNAIYGTYTLPINPQNGTLKLSGQWNATNVIEEPFDQLDITGDSLYLDFTYRQPVLQNPSQELALGLTGSYSASQTTLLGVDFPLSPGANDQGQTKIAALRFFQEWTQRGAEDVLALRSQFSFGLGLLDATTNDKPPDGRFFEWRSQGQYVRLLAPDTLFVFRSALQLSTDPLVPLEQLTLGGLNSVRGYRQDFFLTDNGIFASAEVRLPILRVSEIEGLLQIAPFIDYGTGWNDQDNPIPTPSPNTLVSLGLGLIWQMGDRLNARLDWGLPLTEFKIQGNTLSQQSLYFSVNYKLF